MNYLSTVLILLGMILLSCSNKNGGKSLIPIADSDSLTVIGHRGAAGLCPENTLAGIRKALELEADRIEIDVHQTKDKVVVVMHDKKVNRTTNGTGYIKDKNLEDIKKLSAGIKFKKEFESEKIPTLEEVINEINGKSVLLIEIKFGDDYYSGIEKNILELIKKHGAEDWCIIQSFEDDILEKVHSLNPKIELHKLFFSSMFYDFSNLSYITEYSVNYNFASKKLISKVHKMGKKINVWTVNKESKKKTLIDLKIDGVITDYPNRFK